MPHILLTESQRYDQRSSVEKEPLEAVSGKKEI